MAGTAILNFTPIFTGDDQPLCFVLKIDDFTILLDVSWGVDRRRRRRRRRL